MIQGCTTQWSSNSPVSSGVSAVRLKNDIGWLALIFMTWMFGMLERFHPYEAPQNTSANETLVTKRWDRILYFTKKWLHLSWKPAKFSSCHNQIPIHCQFVSYLRDFPQTFQPTDLAGAQNSWCIFWRKVHLLKNTPKIWCIVKWAQRVEILAFCFLGYVFHTFNSWIRGLPVA